MRSVKVVWRRLLPMPEYLQVALLWEMPACVAAIGFASAAAAPKPFGLRLEL